MSPFQKFASDFPLGGKEKFHPDSLSHDRGADDGMSVAPAS
jgi:hypothetical protein